MVFESIFNGLSGALESLFNSVPSNYVVLSTLIFFTIFITLYAILVFKFYSIFGKRDIIKINFSKYDNYKNPFFAKTLAMFIYGIEYIIILPFLVFLWFIVTSMFMIVLSSSGEILQILIISGAIIAATRVSSYINEDLAKDLAKIVPFVVLVFFMVNPESFNMINIFKKIAEIPNIFDNILVFLIFIFVLELILRIFYVIYWAISYVDGKEEKKKKEEIKPETKKEEKVEKVEVKEPLKKEEIIVKESENQPKTVEAKKEIPLEIKENPVDSTQKQSI